MNDITELKYALQQGHQIEMQEDGGVRFSQSMGDESDEYVWDFECGCLDKEMGGSYHGYCLHEIWTGQMRPCDVCGGVMIWALDALPEIGGLYPPFVCENCSHILSFDDVQKDRRLKKQLLAGDGLDAFLSWILINKHHLN